MLLLDSNDVAPAERVEMVTSVMAEASGATVEMAPHPHVHARMEVWPLGRAHLFRSASSGMRMQLDERRARRDTTPPIVALAVQERSVGRHAQFDERRTVAAGELMVVDLTAPFDFSWRTDGASRALQLPVAELGLPMDLIRAAAPRLHTSPLCGLLTGHVVDLFRAADRISADATAPAVGAASIDLARALLVSAAAPDARTTDRQTLLAQVREYVRQHLRDPDLSAARIARAHHISVRHLYRLCEQAEFSLEQWIIGRRLEGAYQDLARPDAAHRSIAATALRWGFRDPAHFTRRFRTAYGLTPRDWRSIAHEERGSTPP